MIPSQLEAALAAPTPRAGDAWRTLVRMQRKSWSWIVIYAVLVAGFVGMERVVSEGGWLTGRVFWIAVVGSPFALAFALFEYIGARGLARDGLVAVARVESLGHGYIALHFGGEGGERRGQWRTDRSLAADATATVLFHPRRRSMFVWADGVCGAARQDARTPLPRAKLGR